ncbi:SAM-dependent methyltransferase [Aliikangiella sp. IMCC44359]|uniref:SAM-dependent methyltransferase n=1 Tax=Aliikangiella sp. IMCC44359 TaxID=3459125 RepID=UPI00403A9167
MPKNGSFVCVGTGITLGAHITPKAKGYIENADVVFVAVSDGVVEKWIEQMNPNVKSLQVYYAEGKSRKMTYRQMQQVMMSEVREGKNVCGAFYGHPGVFALAPHKTVKQALKEGFYAHMEPGISAEDCLYADLGIDPGALGCQHYEASQLLFYKRYIDTSAYLILWQVGIVGDKTHFKFSTGRAYREIFLNELLKYYPADHNVLLYEAPTLPINHSRIEEISLELIIDTQLNPETTLVLPPCQPLVENKEVTSRLLALEGQS